MKVRILILVAVLLAAQPIRNWIFRIGALIVLALAVLAMLVLLSAEKPRILVSLGMALLLMVVALVAVLVFQTARD